LSDLCFVRPIALDSADIGIARLVVALEHIEHRCPRKQQRDIIGALGRAALRYREDPEKYQTPEAQAFIRRWLPLFPQRLHPTSIPRRIPVTRGQASPQHRVNDDDHKNGCDTKSKVDLGEDAYVVRRSNSKEHSRKNVQRQIAGSNPTRWNPFLPCSLNDECYCSKNNNDYEHVSPYCCFGGWLALHVDGVDDGI
jgi:hypothetical protein